MTLQELMQLQASGNVVEAEAGYRQLIELPEPPYEALGNLGIICATSGRVEEALSLWDRAIGRKRDYVEAHFNIARVRQKIGDLIDARASYLQVINYAPHLTQAYYLLGRACMALQEHNEAAKYLREVVAREPENLQAINDLARSLVGIGELDEAFKYFHRALEINPDILALHVNMCAAYLAAKDIDRAEKSIRRALEIDGDNAYALHSLATVLVEKRDLDGAIEHYRKAIASDPKLAESYNDLGNQLREQGALEEAAEAYKNALECRPGHLTSLANYVMNANYLAEPHQSDLLEHAADWSSAIPRVARIKEARDFSPERRLRIAYVSGDFRNHPVGYFMQSVLANHCAENVEVFCYANQGGDDAMTDRLKAFVDHWVSVGTISDAKFVELIEQHAIDILVDLSGHTAGSRLPVFAQKPAPVQISWLGYFGSTGLPEMDYVLADRYVAPEESEQFFSEKIWRLPHSYLCFEGPELPAESASPPVESSGCITFGCFNNRSKITPQTLELWARLMNAVPDSRLFLKYRQYSNQNVKGSLLSDFALHGIEAERIIFEGRSPRSELLASYNRVDIALDPMPFGGGTTTAEAAWMGVPVVCIRGDRWVGRVSESILETVGLGEMVARDAEEFVEIAKALANDVERLSEIRSGLRGRMRRSPFCDGPTFAANLEDAYRQMWRKACIENIEEAHS